MHAHSYGKIALNLIFFLKSGTAQTEIQYKPFLYRKLIAVEVLIEILIPMIYKLHHLIKYTPYFLIMFIGKRSL